MRRLLIVFAILLGFAFLVATAAIFFAGGSRPLGGPRILSWRIAAPVVDLSETPELSWLHRTGPQSLTAVHQILSTARDDDRVEGLAIHIQDTRFGLGKAQEIISLLESFRSSGKSVDCYLETAGEGTNGTLTYYLASACERITMSPLGDWNVIGLYSDTAFIRGTLDKLHIEPQFLHVGDYKSATEFYTDSEHSPAAEEALGAVLDDLYDQMVSAIANARGLTPEVVRDLIDRAPLAADSALAAGLIDEVAYPDEFTARLTDTPGGLRELAPLEDYAAGSHSSGRRKVAVVVAQGVIVRGENGTDPWSQQRYVGAEALGEILRPLADDPDLTGVVIRVDSPGGSALASDLILREIELLSEAKPVVVSMSDVAASGGYYISSKAAKIVAEPATITGSIGVFGGKLATRRFQQELLGVSHDSLQRGANADYFSSLDPFTPRQEEQFLTSMQRIYDVFVGHVAAGRGLSRAEVEAVAAGRIWTGKQALAVGLVDELGGLERAIELVLETAGVDPDTPTHLEVYPRPPSLLELLSEGLAPLLELRARSLFSLPGPPVSRALELPAGLVRALTLS